MDSIERGDAFMISMIIIIGLLFFAGSEVDSNRGIFYLG